jgi:hypothetical protein
MSETGAQTGTGYRKLADPVRLGGTVDTDRAQLLAMRRLVPTHQDTRKRDGLCRAALPHGDLNAAIAGLPNLVASLDQRIILTVGLDLEDTSVYAPGHQQTSDFFGAPK